MRNGTHERLRAGVVGIGEIGGGVAICLARASLLSAVYDVRHGAADGLEGVPPVCASPAEVARLSDVIFVAVLSASQVLDALNGSDGVLAGARPNTAIVLLSTVSLEDLSRIRDVTQASGLALVDAGVSGGPQAAKKGMILLVGGDDGVLRRIAPVLESVCKSVAHMGGPGAGMTAKIARNTIMIGCLRAAYEGACLAKAAGIDMDTFVKVMLETDNTGVGPMMFNERKADPAFDPVEAKARQRYADMIVKDMKASQKLAIATGIKVPLMDLTLETVDEIVGFAAHS